MQNFDSDKAARVWQRVRSEAPTAQELSGLPALAMLETELEAYFRRLARRHPTATELAGECRRSAQTLRGICDFAGIPCEAAAFTGNTPNRLLQTCYGKTLQALREYEARQTHPEYGCAFGVMAERKRRQACLLLEMAGKG